MSSELSTGAVFAERYRIERRLAAGGMGAVYEVVHIETNRRRALKVLHAKFMRSEAVRERFRQEARVAGEVDSEHIVDIFDAGIDSETEMPFLVMELLRGEDLKARVRRDGPLPPDEAIRCLYETCLALEKTHRANIVHRDLKPDNLFLCEREHAPPRIKVLDFGIAKIVADGSTEKNQVTQSLGTPLYMAPEQFSMNSSVSPATDIFALGLIAYTLLVGKPYWSAESKQARSPIAFALHASRGPQESAVERAAKRQITLPPGFDAWFFRATAVKPEDRFQSAMVAITELAEVLGTPLPHDSLRSKSIVPMPIESTADKSAIASDAHAVPVVDEPVIHNGPHSASLLSVRTVGSSGMAELPRPSRPRPVVIAAGVMAILMAGPLMDGIFGTRPQPAPGATSATSSSATNSFVETSVKDAVEIPSATAPIPTLSASAAAAPPVADIEPPKPVPTIPTTVPTTPRALPSGTAKKHHSVIWNND